MTPHPTFQASVDSVIIGKKLSALSPGEEITYEALSLLVPGRELRGKHRYILETGRGLALKENNVVTGCVSGKGVKRLTDEEIVDIPDATIAGLRRVAKKASRKVLCADYDKMGADDKKKFNSGLSVLGALLQFTTNKSLNYVAERAEKSANRLPVDETLTLFLKASK